MTQSRSTAAPAAAKGSRVTGGPAPESTCPQHSGADRRVERQDVPRRRADVEPVADAVDGDGRRPRQDEGRKARAGLEVEHADVAARGDIEPVAAGRDGRSGIAPALLDGDIGHRRAERARRRDGVIAEGDEPAGHDVLRQVRVGVLVDRMRLPIAPVLQELGGRPRVVDLVEVHSERLPEPEGPQEQRRDHEHDDEPQVEPVEPAATLVVEEMRAVEARPPGQ